ncbi:MAG: hypothetical protein AB2601_19830 [Candidatus Thiodiazotropha sp.]
MIKISPFGSLIAFLFAGAFVLSGGAASITHSPFDWLVAVSSSAKFINIGFGLSLFTLAIYVFFSSAIFELYLSEKTKSTVRNWRLTTVVGFARRLLVANFWLSIFIFPDDYGAFLISLYGILLVSHRLLVGDSDAASSGSDKYLWYMDAIQVALLVVFILFIQAAATAPVIKGNTHQHFIELARIIGFLETGFYLQIILGFSLFYIIVCTLVNKWEVFRSLDVYVALLISVVISFLLHFIGNLTQYTERVSSDILGVSFPYLQFPISAGNFGVISAVILVLYLIVVIVSIVRIFKEHNALSSVISNTEGEED